MNTGKASRSEESGHDMNCELCGDNIPDGLRLCEDCAIPSHEPTRVNNGFWDLPPETRASIKQSACERGGVSDFYDLSPEERARAYDRE